MSDTTSMDMSLNESSDGVDMTRPATVLSREHVYQGAIFGVEDMRIALQTRDGGQTVIRRQVMRHAPCVVMLVHDCAQDLYLVEREYRVGCDAFAYGLPAGLIDDGEDVDAAALRELREETGVEPIDENSCDIDHVGQFYSSEGMTDELANIMVVHTPPGHASMVALEIDSAAHPFFLGSVAGDDTVLVVLNEEVEREDARSVILGIVPQLDNQNSSEENNG